MDQISKSKVLLVDDTTANIDVVLGVLQDDCEMMVARDGKTALEIVASDPPDLILLDIMMPLMNGYEVCKQLKANQKTQKIPVIFLTAKNEIADEIKGFELGAIDYIKKPISPPILKARVNTHLSLLGAAKNIAKQNEALLEAAKLREDVENIVHHDLKSPLNAILGIPQLLLLENEISEECKKLLLMLTDAGHKMLSMINLSLDLFKMERGLYRFQPQEINLLKVIHDIFNDNQVKLQEKQISTSILINDCLDEKTDCFPLMAEALLCYSMLSNLFTNALEASPDGEQIIIHFENREKLSISINNQGEVPESIRETFFDKYVTSGKVTGTGLGTYSAKLIAKTQKGSIHLKSSKEEGTTVTVKFSA